jgi:hypothetical protein
LSSLLFSKFNFMFEPGLIYRIPIYMSFGIVCEVLFTALYDLIRPDFLKSWNIFSNNPQEDRPQWRDKRDVRAIGYTFLWMLPIYALICLLEPLVEILAPYPFFVRSFFYMLGIWLIEFIGGWVIKLICGKIPWDYSLSRTHIKGLIRLDFFPYWFLFGLAVEWLIKKLHLLTPVLMQTI